MKKKKTKNFVMNKKIDKKSSINLYSVSLLTGKVSDVSSKLKKKLFNIRNDFELLMKLLYS